MKKRSTARPDRWEWSLHPPLMRLRYLAIVSLLFFLASWGARGFHWVGADRIVRDHSLPQVQGVPVRWITSANPGLFSPLGSPPRLDQSVMGRPMTIAGKDFSSGIGTKTPSKILLDLGGRYERFTGWVGLDGAQDRFQTTLFRVFADGRLVFQSPSMARGTEPCRVDLPVQGVRTLCLAADPSNYLLEPDDADWADLQFQPLGAGPDPGKGKP